mgnify:CR=1 FL=1
MPELPEVETIVRSIAPALAGRRILAARACSALVARSPLEAAVGQRVRAVGRRGKHIVVELERGVLDIHLGMTGRLLLGSERGPYTRAWFDFDGASLVYDDIRQFGRVEYGERLPERTARLGPDALAVTADEFALRLGSRRARIKPLLMDQSFLSGLGNIYADEALFRARIHPRAAACRLSRQRAGRLHRAITEVLREALEHGGSSISDYVDGEGRAGTFQALHRVYGRQGLPCPVCGRAIRRMVLAQRGTHYCARCQRM